MTPTRFPRLHPAQVCFVVEDVEAAVEECVSSFGWGPFHCFSVAVPEARYHDWTGSKNMDVALGMAGGVQVELIHVHEGRDSVAAYQTRYGTGFQHLGISCRDREQALAALEGIGGRVDDRGEVPGVRFAFVDTPTGPGQFELLETTSDAPGSGAGAGNGVDPTGAADDSKADAPPLSVTLDRATIVTDDLERALGFYSQAFRWDGVRAEARRLRFGRSESRVRRARGQAGQLLLELVEPERGSDDPYARHLDRGDHGFVHAGGLPRNGALPAGATTQGEWLEDGESFALYAWSGGPGTLQLRTSEPA
jgi:catechol 2,3-dioxygenase-like lactoylglutathione lyase family enzyme